MATWSAVATSTPSDGQKTNTLTHTAHETPRAELTVRVGAEHVELVITDDSPPIPVQEIRVLRGDLSVGSVSHGSGLGLWLVYWAVSRSDGELGFDTPTERGNTVRISLARVTS